MRHQIFAKVTRRLVFASMAFVTTMVFALHGTPAQASQDPIGWLDLVSSPGPGQIRIAGWAFDRDAPYQSVVIHAYVGGGAGVGEGHNDSELGVADKTRRDVAAVYPGTGEKHGFDSTFSTHMTGYQPVCVYALNIGGGNNPMLKGSCKYVTITPSQTQTIASSQVRGYGWPCGHWLDSGDALVLSPYNGHNYQLVMQTDGNLVFYDTTFAGNNTWLHNPLWSSNTYNTSANTATLQCNGYSASLRVYDDRTGITKWRSPSIGYYNYADYYSYYPYSAELALQNDGNLVIYARSELSSGARLSSFSAPWATGTNGPRRHEPVGQPWYDHTEVPGGTTSIYRRNASGPMPPYCGDGYNADGC